ncbi:DUF4286 family protein [Roseovarius indicus]|uniref:DUF4286 family protein n=1 Tax=Roseovarius indicus TaxID=540747 RepID=UPI000AEDC2E4|nr:DUF4286 family protein [Roseovarius indicus]
MTRVTDATGLMAFWADIEPGYVLRYQEWHNCEHVPERVSIPGFLRGRRYRAEDGTPHFLMMYETEAPEVLSSDAYLAALNAPTDWTREALTYFRHPTRNIYRRVEAAGRELRFCAPWLISLQFNRDEAPGGADVAPWLAAMAEAPGIGRVQLWAVDEAVSGIQTSERKIYGGGPGEQKYLLLVEAEAPHPSASEALAAADAAAPAMGARKNEVPGRFWLEIAHEDKTAGKDEA